VDEKPPQSQAEMMKRTSGAKPNTKIVIKGGTVKQSSMADQQKLQGNAFFLSLEYDKAIDCYTRCLTHIDDSNHALICVVYSNRAQCHIKLKKYEQAF
jgi:tetratricopeptide (TPR) repeat protein